MVLHPLWQVLGLVCRRGSGDAKQGEAAGAAAGGQRAAARDRGKVYGLPGGAM